MWVGMLLMKCGLQLCHWTWYYIRLLKRHRQHSKLCLKNEFLNSFKNSLQRLSAILRRLAVTFWPKFSSESATLFFLAARIDIASSIMISSLLFCSTFCYLSFGKGCFVDFRLFFRYNEIIIRIFL